MPIGSVLTMFDFIDLDEGRLMRRTESRPGAGRYDSCHL
jgi:hypothetical protein